jgi:hypothetical protein
MTGTMTPHSLLPRLIMHGIILTETVFMVPGLVPGVIIVFMIPSIPLSDMDTTVLVLSTIRFMVQAVFHVFHPDGAVDLEIHGSA